METIEGQQQPGTALVDIRKQLAADAAEISKRIAAQGGAFIKCTQDKKFQMPDKTEQPGPLTCVVVDFISANYFFDRPYRQGEVVPPSCFALGLEPRSLKPHETSPAKEAEECNTCPNNEFGSGPGGKGKACANSRLLAVVAPGDEEPTIYLIKVSATGVKPFDNYVQTIKTNFNTTPLALITDVYFEPTLKYGSLRFGNPRPNPRLEQHFGLRARAREILLTAPDVSQYKPLPPVPVKAAGAKR